jgi:hypothetical protein
MSFFRFFTFLVIFAVTLSASVGKVFLLKGDAFAMRGGENITLQTGSKIEEKDTVSTGKTGQIQILFEDKTVITLGNTSTFKIEEYLNQEQKPKAKFSFAQGTFKTITGKIGKRAPENFTLETKTATIGIRGTIIRGKLGDRSDKIMCEKGAIGVRSNITGREIFVPMGRVIVLPHDAPPLPVRDVQPSDLAELSLNTDPTPPDAAPANGSNPSDNPPAGTPPADNQPPSGNQAPLSADNIQPFNNAPTPPAPLSTQQMTPLLQSFTPDVANNALQTSFKTIQQDNVAKEVITPPTEPEIITPPTEPEIITPPTEPEIITPPAEPEIITPPAEPEIITPPTAGGGGGEMQCPAGYTGTYPNCSAPVSFSLKGLATSGYYDSYGTPQHGSNDFNVSVNNSNASGFLTLASGNTLDLNLSTFSGTTAQNFTLSDFNTSGTWLGTASDSPNSTISWGKWTSVELDNNLTLMPGTNNFWVAGSDLTGGASYIADVIANQTTTYTYIGKVLGSVYDQTNYYPIDPSSDPTNEVRLHFNFANGHGTFANNNSYLRFSVNGLYWFMPMESTENTQVSTNGTFNNQLNGTSIYGNIFRFF